MKAAKFLGAIAACVMSLVASAAAAEEAKRSEGNPTEEARTVDWKKLYEHKDVPALSIAPYAGWGTNNMGFGIGARVGYTIKQRVYFGGSAVYHVGESYKVGASDLSIGIFLPSVEIGYDARVDSAVLRPYVGTGYGILVLSSGNGTGAAESSGIVYPGLALTYAPEDSHFFGGVDSRLFVSTEGGKVAFGGYATFGVRF